jgi:hypothetical protein
MYIYVNTHIHMCVCVCLCEFVGEKEGTKVDAKC